MTNKVIDGKQMTAVWHVDNLKISHTDKAQVTKFIEWLEGICGKQRTTRGEKHDYMDMQLDYSIMGEVRLTMYSKI